MSTKNTSDVIIIGAGLSGLTVAKLLNDSGLKCTVLERKNSTLTTSLSTIYDEDSLKNIFGELDLEKPKELVAERYISTLRAYLLKEDSYISASSSNLSKKLFISFKHKLNSLLAKTIQKMGVSVLYEKVARDLIFEDGKIVGVKCDDDELYSKLVVVAEGANPVFTKRAGLRKGDLFPDQVFLFAEEKYLISSKDIEQKLKLELSEGTSIRVFPRALLELSSIAYLNTNKDSISIGVGISLSESLKKKININDLLTKIKNHQAFAELISNANLSGYNSYVLPVPHISNKNSLPRLIEDGCIVTGSATMMIDLTSWESSSKIIELSKIASEVIIKAKESNSFSIQSLSLYEKLLFEKAKLENAKTNKSGIKLVSETVLNDNASDFSQEFLNELTVFANN